MKKRVFKRALELATLAKMHCEITDRAVDRMAEGQNPNLKRWVDVNFNEMEQELAELKSLLTEVVLSVANQSEWGELDDDNESEWLPF